MAAKKVPEGPTRVDCTSIASAHSLAANNLLKLAEMLPEGEHRSDVITRAEEAIESTIYWADQAGKVALVPDAFKS